MNTAAGRHDGNRVKCSMQLLLKSGGLPWYKNASKYVYLIMVVFLFSRTADAEFCERFKELYFFYSVYIA